MAKVQTVTGEIRSDQLGITFPHEHLLFDLTCYFKMPEEATKRQLANAKVEISNLGEIRRNPLGNRDDAVNYDAELAARELMFLKRAGGNSIVDLTNNGLGRDPKAVRGISIQTGIQVVMGCGYYVASSHPPKLAEMSTEDITREIVSEVELGIGGTDIRAGIIGEIGTSWPMVPSEEKVLRAAARAQLKTKKTLNIHCYCGQSLPDVKAVHKLLDIVEDEGVDPSRVILSHMDGVGLDIEVHDALAKRGAYLSYDCFGSEMFFENVWWEPRDTDRIRAVKDMIKRKKVTKLLLSHDVCYKVHLRAYGGYGYDHILRNIVPMMLMQGVSQKDIDTMMVSNPSSALTGE